MSAGLRLIHIAAMAENRAIGRGGDMPWRIREEMRHFKRTTTGHIVLMGRKTFAAVGKPLPNRLNVVLSRDPGYGPEGVLVFSSLDEALTDLASQTEEWGGTIYVIGGEEIYRQTLPRADGLCLSVVHTTIPDADAFYPEFSAFPFREVSSERYDADPPFTVYNYERTVSS